MTKVYQQMKQEWREFLQKAGAEIDDDLVRDFGNPERENRAVLNGDIITDLSHHGLIVAHGDDTVTFFQNQFCNDINAVDTGHCQLSAHCSAKGRILSAFRVVQRDGSYYLSLPREILEETLKKLRMYVLRSKVTLEDASEAFVRIGLSGPRAEQLLSGALGEIPAGVDEVVTRQDYSILRLPGLHPRFEIWGELDAIQQLWGKLDVHAAPVGSGLWQWLDIRAGLPSIHPATVDSFVPQMVNLEALGGVSFRKGCYPGQEVVARMRYLGTLKRRMYLAHLDQDTGVQPGDPLFAAGAESGQGAGKVVAVQPHPEGGLDLLAVIVIDSAGGEPIHLHAADGPRLTLLELPYTFETAGKSSGGEA